MEEIRKFSIEIDEAELSEIKDRYNGNTDVYVKLEDGFVRSKGVRVALTTTFGGGWASVMKEAGKHCLKYGGRKALGCITGVVCGYFGSASVVLITKSTKIIKCVKVCHSVCSGGLDVAELCASAPINMIEILIFGRPVIIEGGGFDLFSKDADPFEEIEKPRKFFGS